MSFSELEAFLARHGDAFRLAISGGANAEALPAMDSWIRVILEPLRRERVLVITGGTRDGVPGIAAHVARRELGMPLLGVLPARGRRYAAEEFIDPNYSGSELTCLVEVPALFGASMWGDESSLFVRLADAILVLDGEWGTTVEVALAMKANSGRVKNGEPPIRIVPVDAFPGPAQVLANAPWMTDAVRQGALPPRPLLTPADVAGYLLGLLTKPRHRP
ncbi:MAG: hypothetical protein Q7S02_02905 [bacterium]|nr:hypothetical protein [bacterium]